MIAEAEIRRYAAQWGVDPMVVDLDYALGWCLAGFGSKQVIDRLNELIKKAFGTLDVSDLGEEEQGGEWEE
jgi:hypothetical protein